MLRRACHIAHGRMQDLDVYDDAGPLLPIMSGACFTFQPERAPVALRMKGTIRDFTDAPERVARTSAVDELGETAPGPRPPPANVPRARR